MFFGRKGKARASNLSQVISNLHRRPVRCVVSRPDGSVASDTFWYYRHDRLAPCSVHKMLFSRRGNLSVETVYDDRLTVRSLRVCLFGVEVTGLYRFVITSIWRTL